MKRETGIEPATSSLGAGVAFAILMKDINMKDIKNQQFAHILNILSGMTLPKISTSF
jgi:hypothetical protein